MILAEFRNRFASRESVDRLPASDVRLYRTKPVCSDASAQFPRDPFRDFAVIAPKQFRELAQADAPHATWR